MRATLRRVWLRLYGSSLPKKLEPFLLALLAIEHRHGEAIYHYNWGNIISLTGKGWRWPPNPNLFRINEDHDTGAQVFIELLHGKTHKRIIDAGMRGDVEGVLHGLGVPHPETKKAYSTDYQREDAKNTFRSLVKKYSQGSFPSSVAPRVNVNLSSSAKRSSSVLPLVLAGGALAFYLWKKNGSRLPYSTS